MLSLSEKYRPKTFKEVVGQDGAVSQLQGMVVRGNIPKALLLGGPYGCGKTTIARIFAKAINCQNPADGNPCLKCSACKDKADILEVNVADDRGIDTMRELVKTSIYAPRYNFRVNILDEFHQATSHAQQALLKPLEDEKGSTIWIICTTDPGAVIPTIVSRCRVIKLDLVPDSAISKYLKRVAKKEKIKLEDKYLKLIAAYSGGHVRDALKSLEAVADALSLGKKLSKADLKRVIEASIGKDDRRAAFKWFLAWLKESSVGMFLAVKEVDRPDQWFVWLTRTYEQLIYYFFYPEAKNPSFKQFFDALDKQKIKVSKERLSILGTYLGEYLSYAKRYVMDPKLAALAFTVRVLPTKNK